MNNSQLNNRGFSLIELMIAMVIGLIILLGLVSLFTSSSNLNRAQTGLSLLQENGRYAMMRIKQDIQNAGRKHCATVALPTTFTTDWDQGYEMSSWLVDRNVTLPHNLPAVGDVLLDDDDDDQLSDGNAGSLLAANVPYPLDPSWFIRGHECGAGSCTPTIGDVGGDTATVVRSMGTTDGNRVPSTDVLTVRYLTGGTRVQSVAGNTLTTMNNIPAGSTGDAIVADCNTTMVTTATWGSNSVTVGQVPFLALDSDTRVFSMNRDFKTVTYFVGVDTDPGNPNRRVSSLYRAENGVAQQLVEGVERLDVFYLAQLQTGHVARLTADQVQGVSGGGDTNNDGAIDTIQGCIIQPAAPTLNSLNLANEPGCLWRSIYAIEVHMLMNTVANSSTLDNEVFIYSPDGLTPQDPSTGLTTGMPAERMHRKEFSAIVPVRSYTL
ncbi:prepilin-type N-terminal cleavage/methylation domain-containing protein [Marinicella meishanensis]|uniref:prepilin-type N-terminal cleavage/methylation domain-containing protein n=1 Tax=Marinicella meishanensis TaxID=2873263 RepID=UPI001CBFCAC3|nr:prepilin-type N-terminal cleavage/methylation domain-containing protein [Marinicella sp. NBU2979]